MDNKHTPIINIENIHIHLDERMFSKNFYNPSADEDFDDCPVYCDECSGRDCEGTPEITDEELVERIHKQTGIPKALIDRILKAENKVLAQWYGNCEEDKPHED